MAEDQNLVPLEDYLKAGIHIGTKFRTKHMEKFVYKVRPDGLSVLNVEQINNRLKLAGKLLADYDPNDIIIVCRRENGWKAVKKFAEIIGLRRGVDVVIYSSIGILFYMLFRLYIKFEEREQEITKVVREIALLKKKNRKR